MKQLRFAALIASTLLAATCAHAETGASIEVGTSGLGAHLTVPLDTGLNARVGANLAHYSYDGNTSDTDYDFKLKLKTIDVLVDYYPSTSAFRLTGGLAYNGNKIEAHAKPKTGGTYSFNGVTYSASTAGKIDGNIDFRKVAPYLGIGWGNAIATEGWGFNADLGVLFQGSPKTSLTNSGCSATAAICTKLASDIAVENQKLADEVKDFKLYPVARIGVSYRF